MSLLPFDQKEGYLWLNGKTVVWKNATIHPLTHGLHYASSVFEGVRIYNGKAFLLSEHIERLHQSAKILGFKIPYSTDDIISATHDLLAKENIDVGYIRHFAWRGSEQLRIYTPAPSTRLAIAAWAFPTTLFNIETKKTLKLTSRITWRKPDPTTAPTVSKAACLYPICFMSKHEAIQQGFDDALMLDYRGLIAESTASNVFLIMDGAVHTPIPDCFLDGITRQTIIKLAKQLGIEVVERHIKPEELAQTQEVFLTGTTCEIESISQIDEQQFEAFGPITMRLIAAYRDFVAKRTAANS
ncbi:branched-chain-amino-acid transaminase [Leptolyngbyaceae cyanobacterium CCMR0082]|uniref:Branched-chain-amino-acid aminotransferase n=1 Tax=Adonisia turfae CCMR0082 TaxID=2304604 RepID=A0A6M0S1U5_9CYAN|nr:branched-chain-amino-acid transaminase [Adonisia turfae]NEZ62447.1 branched-chain-amino-acid transaminase [Adonisia turfae CCMR0082]